MKRHKDPSTGRNKASMKGAVTPVTRKSPSISAMSKR